MQTLVRRRAELDKSVYSPALLRALVCWAVTAMSLGCVPGAPAERGRPQPVQPAPRAASLYLGQKPSNY